MQTSTPPIIQVRQLQKHFQLALKPTGRFSTLRSLFRRTYRTVRAVDGISFDIHAGELVGYLGPNGAGKSTTIKMLTGLLVPSGGDLRVNGLIPWKNRVQYVGRIGAVFGQRTTLWWDVPVIESFELLKHIYKIPEQQYQENLAEFSKILELEPFLNTPVRSLSLGQRMRADICAALFHNPDLLFLDEPTIGLDVVAKERIRQFILHINQERKTTIILTTHDLSDVEKLCERVMIIDHGQLLFDGSLDEIKQRFGDDRELVVDFAESYPSYEVAGARIHAVENRKVTYRFQRKTLSASELIRRVTELYRVHDLLVREPEIETTIRKIYEEKLLEKPGADSLDGS